MALIRAKEQQAEKIAHLLDDALRVPGTKLRIGADPLAGIIPVFGDALVTAWGAAILIYARQLNVPWSVLTRMAYNQFKNGLIGAVPFVGDLYSFGFKSNALNAALMLRAVKHGKEGTCSLTTRPLGIQDAVGLMILILPNLAVISFASFWFWDHNISYFSIVFSTFYEIQKDAARDETGPRPQYL
jgi:hypothetical protein